MDTAVRDLSLRAHAFLSSSVRQVQGAFQACLDLYSPETWLILYYPLFYLAKIVKRYSQWTAKQGQGIFSDWLPLKGEPDASPYTLSALFKKEVLPFFILGPLCYVFLLHYHFLDSRSWRTTSPIEELSKPEKESSYDAISRVPERLLQTNVDIGLTEDEALERQKVYGPNEILTTRNWFYVFARLALRTTNLVLEATALLAVVIQDQTDLVITCSLLAFNFFTDIQSIRQYDDYATNLVGDLAGYHNTYRGGSMMQIPNRDLVPGDIVHIEQGQTIMVEGRVIASSGRLSIDQSTITGESEAINKRNGDMCYSGTGVTCGNATLIVVATGHQTFQGRTLATLENPLPPLAHLLYNRLPPRHVQEYRSVLHSIGLIFSILIVVALGIIRNSHDPVDTSCRIFSLSLGLAMLVIPISLPTLVARLRARGADRLGEQGALLQTQQITNAECLAGIDVFCSDKTGTLTANKLDIREPYCIACGVEDLILTACLSGSPDHENLDPIDQAILDKLDNYPQTKRSLEGYKISEYVDFDPTAKRTWAWAESPNGRRNLCTKGAPKAVLDLCAATSEVGEKYREMASKFARQGYRCLGVALKLENEKWDLLGLLPIFDPPRKDIVPSIKLAKTLGVTVKMLTGDAVTIAREHAGIFGIGTNVINADLCDDDRAFSNPALSTTLDSADAYAEVFPKHKERIIQIHQCQGHRVAVTGDGVDDARSLKTANCGIAVEGSAEIAMSASDICMQTPGLAAMLSALQISRQTFWTVWTYVTYRTTLSFHLIGVLLGSFAVYKELPDLKLILLNIHFSDIVGVALASEDRDTPFPRKPARWSTRRLFTSVIPLSAILITGTWFSLAAIPTEADTASISASRRQIVYLHAILSDHWPFLVARVDGRLRLQVRDWRAVITFIALGLLATLACIFGWVSEGQQMSAEMAIHVWLCSFATVCTAIGLRIFILDDELYETV